MTAERNAVTPELTPLKRAFLALEEARARIAALESGQREPIAIIGVGCRVPGADGPAAFWRLLESGTDATGDVPADRWDADAYYDADPEAEGRITSRRGGFLRDVDRFDAEFFGIAPREARGLDPQQRLLLEVSWEALEHAGIAADRLEGSSTGVYIGMAASDYANAQIKSADPALLNAHFASGIAHSMGSGRLSYLMGLQGPSITIDTACSSSLVALHLACQALHASECRLALAGGVNLMLAPDLAVALSHSRMLAPDGRCKTFDAAADGFARGEGCGIVVLKRLRDALADGDRVLAVVRGTAVNQDGPSSGLTAPNGPAQEAVIREAIRRAGLKPADIGYLEAHGTGTQLGDPLEMGAIGNVFGNDRPADSPLLVGSVKTNVGHLEGAAGVTSVIKVVLALRERTIPSHLHFRNPSPHIAWDQLPVRVPTTCEPWPPISGRRIGGVSSFGFSGTNAHVVLEEAPESPRTQPRDSPGHLLVLSAREDATLRQLAGRYATALRAPGAAALLDACFTAATGRARLPQRAAITASDRGDMIARLDALATGGEAEGVRVAHVAGTDPPRIAFLFTGQGAQYHGMACRLYERVPAFREPLDRCAAILDPLLGQSLLALLREDGPVLDETRFTQPVLFAVEYAMAAMWRRFGIEPIAVMGHSVGEYVAACIAGVLNLEDALRLITTRGRLMQSLPAGGAMMAIFAPEAAVRAELGRTGGRVAIAAVNAPGQAVVSGAAADVAALGELFGARGVRCQALPVSHAFHSPLVEPVLDEFEAIARGVTYNPARIRLVSNLTGQLATGTECANATYWRRHMREAVRFEDGLRALATLRPDLLVEVGPHPTLLSFAEATLGPDGPARIATLRRNRDDGDELRQALGALYLAGADVNWRQVYERSGAKVVDLPTYPFRRDRYWFSARSHAGDAGNRPAHPLLGTRLPSPLPQAIYQSNLSAEEPAFLAQHVVQGHVIVPATAWLELLRAAGSQVLPGAVGVADVSIDQAMILEGREEVRRVQAIIEPVQGGAAAMRVLSQRVTASPGESWECHVTARATTTMPMLGGTLEQARATCRDRVDLGQFYEAFARRGLTLGASFQPVDALMSGEGQALGHVMLREDDRASSASYGIHPVLLDGCLQVLAAALPQGDDASLYLPVGLGCFALIGSPGVSCWSHVVLDGPPAESVGATIRVFDEAGSPVAILERIRLQRVAADAIARLGSRWLDDAMLELHWPPIEREAASAPAWSLQEIAVSAGAGLADTRRAANLDAYDAFLPALDTLCLDYVSRAMTELGWKAEPGTRVAAGSLAQELGVAQRHRRLFARLLAILAEGGVLGPAGEEWKVERPLTASDPEPRRAALLQDHPFGRPELEMTGRAGARLAAALRGECDPMELLFPAGSLDTAERLYRDSPPAVVMNGMMARAVAAAAAAAPAGRPLRILEIGAGTGGTTAHVLPVLGNTTVEYTFTDIGALFVARARERFGATPGMRFATLDLERNLVEQGFPAGHFDLVIASNVVHATRDLRQTLGRIREVLLHGGLLAMLEVTAPQRWFDLTVGLTPGWWAFDDLDLRPDYPAMARDRWISVLADAGFSGTSVPNGSAPVPGVLGLQALLLAQATVASTPGARTWLVLADAQGAMHALVASLRSRGDRCVVVRRSGQYAETGDEVSLDPRVAAQFDRLIERHGAGLSGVVYGWPLDAEPESLATSDLAHLPHFLGAIHLTQALLRRGDVPRLWMITRGGQAVAPAGQGLEPLQGTVWGLVRTLTLEHPELGATAVDLDPSLGPANVDGLEALLDQPPAELQVVIRQGTAHGARLGRLRRGKQAAAAPWRLVAARQSLDGLERVPLERRLPGPGFVEIEVEATGLNFKDVLNALGMYPGDPGPLGGECAGRVVAVGPGVDQVRPGDEVVALAPGSFASHVIARADFVLSRPLGMSAEEAATFPIAFLTAHFCLDHVAKLRAGERVLIHAATGGVGMAAVRIAQRIGAEVHATAGAPWKQELLRAMGVRHIYDSRSTSFADGVLAATAGAGVDVILNSLTGEMLDASFTVLAPRGRFVEIGKRGLWSEERVSALGKNHSYHVIDWGEVANADPALIRGMMTSLLADTANGALPSLPRHTFTADHCADAFRFMARARHAGRIVVRHPSVGGPGLTPSPRGTYLITGGLSGLGLVVARRLAERGAGRLVLIGRRGVPSAAQGELDALRRLTQVESAALDVSDEAGLRALLDRIRQDGPPLRGIIHSAGVVHDAGFLSQDAETVAAVFAPKVAGATLLDRLTRGDALDFFVLFSSVAGVLGSSGQANHAGANAFLDLLAARRRAEGLPGLSVAWGPWSEVGAAADRGMAERLAALGLGAVTPEQGLQALDRALSDDLVQVVVQPADWRRVLSREPRRATLLSELTEQRDDAAPSGTTSAIRRGLREEVAEAPAGRARHVVAAFVRERALKALGLDPGRALDPGTPLGELGLDSLLAVELRNNLGTAIGKTLPATLLFDYPTVDALTDVLLRELGVDDAAATAAASSPPPAGALASIEELSDEEVERRLAARARKRR